MEEGWVSGVNRMQISLQLATNYFSHVSHGDADVDSSQLDDASSMLGRAWISPPPSFKNLEMGCRNFPMPRRELTHKLGEAPMHHRGASPTLTRNATHNRKVFVGDVPDAGPWITSSTLRSPLSPVPTSSKIDNRLDLTCPHGFRHPLTGLKNRRILRPRTRPKHRWTAAATSKASWMRKHTARATSRPPGP